ncbi:MAG: PLP-dependent aminotransferase family protein [Alphaproteobacteria bacterium]|nr:PLP-dependent aminotransferase family protein [Alphaproteobacteria bacterium]
MIAPDWTPDLTERSGPRYVAIAEAIGDAIESKELPAGTRLPTHRELAWRLGVTVGTVSRAYGEAERRGLIVGEVGRGTFVRADRRYSRPFRSLDPEPSLIDMSHNHPVRSPEMTAAIGHAVMTVARAADFGGLLDYHPYADIERHRAAGAAWLTSAGLPSAPERVIVTNGAQHAMWTVLSAVAQPGDTLLAETLTYPGIKAVTASLGLRLKGVAMDSEGVLPDAFAAACGGGGVKALYLVPTLQNPTTRIMSLERRLAIAAVAEAHNVVLVEDDVCGYLVDGPPPIAALAPEQAVYITSLSKSVAPGLRIGYALAPGRLGRPLASALRATTLMATPLAAAVAAALIESGEAERIAAAQRLEAAARQAIMRRHLAPHVGGSHPEAYHVWLPLPAEWRAEDFAEAARARGVGVGPAPLFAVGRGDAVDGVRICIGQPADRGLLEHALAVVAELLAAGAGAARPSLV